MASSQKLKLEALEDFLKDYPHITYATPSSPNYASLRAIYIRDNPAVPLAIVRPQTAEDVVKLVRYATSNGISFVVRSGGHDMKGRSQVEDALTIDMRDIAYVDVDEGKSSAKVGGGTLLREIGVELAKQGLVTAVGTIPSVGYVGWATYGGYGPFVANFGLGVDNILAAKVVNGQGEVLDADLELLKGLRGAGGAFGIITELTIKVYPLKKILAGVLMYDSTDFRATYQKFNERYEALSSEGFPPQLTAEQGVFNTPQGRFIATFFLWSGEDAEAGRTYLAKIEALGNVVFNQVALCTVPEWQKGLETIVAPSVYGTCQTINIRKLTSEVIGTLVDILDKLPTDPGSLFQIHELRGPSASPDKESVFGSREPHFMLEIIGTTAAQENLDESLKWAQSSVDKLRHTDADNILPGTYISLDMSSETSLDKLYGQNYQSLLEIKQKYDPENVFHLALPLFNKE